jgi:hypothetical protein
MNTSKSVRIRVKIDTVETIKKAFPGQTLDAGISTLAARWGQESGDPVSCGQKELWIKTDRLEEIIGLLALTNMDIADQYRRMVSRDLGLFRAAATKLTAVAREHQMKANT